MKPLNQLLLLPLLLHLPRSNLYILEQKPCLVQGFLLYTSMINWILIVWITASADFEIWGGYQTLAACESSLSMLDARYERKRQTFRAVCQPVMARQLQP